MKRLAQLSAFGLALVLLTGATPTPTPEGTPEPAATEAPTVRDQEYWIKDLGIDKVWKTTKGKGVTFTLKPARQPWGGYMGMFADPDGNVFYLDQAPSQLA